MESKKPDKVLINTIGPWLDKGESGILIAMVNSLKKISPTVEITVSASTYKLSTLDIEKYSGYSMEVIPGILFKFHDLLINLTRLRFKPLKMTIAFIYLSYLLISTSIWALLYNYLNIDLGISNRELLRKYAESDWIFVCGGQNIVHFHQFPLIPLYEIFISKLLQKKVMLYAQSSGPFLHNYSKPFIKWILNKTDIITTREKISKDTLIDLGIKVPLFVTADAAFTLPSISRHKSLSLLKKDSIYSDDDLNIAITAIPWDFPKESNCKKKVDMYDNYVNSLAMGADYLIKKYNANIIFFPQVTIPDIKNDIPISKKVLSKMQNKSNVSILQKDYSPEELKGMYGCMDLLIGTRFHSCIFSLSMDVSTLAIEYDGHKAYGIMKLLGLEEFVIEIEKINLEIVKQKTDELIRNNEQIKKRIESSVKILKQNSEKNIILAQEYL
jgi:colanic acid/amylovoran biosynthesis protein